MFRVVSSKCFDQFILGAIVCNVGVMSINYWEMEDHPTQQFLYQLTERLFTNFFYAECVLKLIGLGGDMYFSERWNRFDFVLIVFAITEDLIGSFFALPPFLLRLMRLVRALRALRVLRFPGAKDLRDLIITIVYSMPSLINICSLLLITTFIFATLGMQMFPYLVYQDLITPYRNFETIGGSALILFQCLTRDDWSNLLKEAMIDEDSGYCKQVDGNCGNIAAIPFFLSYQVARRPLPRARTHHLPTQPHSSTAHSTALINRPNQLHSSTALSTALINRPLNCTHQPPSPHCPH